MNKLLKDAIADAKAVRETALANAKLALEEAFLPKMQSMLSSKIREEMEEEEPEADSMDDKAMNNRMKELAGISEEEDEMPADEEGGEEDYSDEGEGGDEDFSDEGEDFSGGEEDFSDEGEEEYSDEEEMSSDDDEQLEAILRELEDDTRDDEQVPSNDEEDEEKPQPMEEEFDLDEIINSLREEEGSEEESEKPVDEEIDLNELLASLNEEEGEEEEEEEKAESKMEGKSNKMKMKKMEEDLNEAYSAVKYLRSKLSEVNLLNAKLLYVNKLFRNNLTETQKVKVIENFDRAKTVREAKLVYATLSESFKAAKASTTKTTTKKSVMEGFASKATKKTNSVLNEGNDQVNRFKKLAGII